MEAFPFIAISLLLMIAVGLLAFVYAGKDSSSSNWDDPERRDPE